MVQDASLPVSSAGPSRSRMLFVIALLTVFGPLVAILPFGIFAAVTKMTASSQVRPGEAADLMLFAILFGYYIAWPYALLTGAIVALWSWWRRPTFVVAVGAALAANAVVYFVAPLLPVYIRLDPFQEPLQILLLLFLSLLAVSVCWLIFRLLVRSP